MLGFPCDQFGHQEPGDDAEIATFCERNYGVTFPMFGKVDVNGPDAHPLFDWLRKAWRDARQHDRVELHQVPGRPRRSVVARYAPTTAPDKLTEDIEKALAD